MKYELSHDTIARQIFEKSSAETKARRKIKVLVERAYARHQNNARIILSKEDLEEIKPFETIILFNKEELHFIQKSKRAIYRRRNLLIGLTALVLVMLAATSIWALNEKSKSEKARQKVFAEKTRATSILLASKAREAQNAMDGTQALKYAAYSTRLDINDESRDILYEQFYKPHRYYYNQKVPHLYQEKSLKKAIITSEAPYQYFLLYGDGHLMTSNDSLVNFTPLYANYQDIRNIATVPGQKTLIISHKDSISLIDYTSMMPVEALKANAKVDNFTLSFDGQTLLSTSDKSDRIASKQVLVWEPFKTDQPVDTLVHSAQVMNVTISADGQLFATETSRYFYIWSREGVQLGRIYKSINLETDIFFYPKKNQKGCYYLIKSPSSFKANSLQVYEWCGDNFVDRTREFNWTLPTDDLGTMALKDNGAIAISGSHSPIYYYEPYFNSEGHLQIGQPVIQLDRRQNTFNERMLFHPNRHQLLSFSNNITTWELSPEFRPFMSFLPESQQTKIQHGLCNLYPFWWSFTIQNENPSGALLKIFQGARANPVIELPFTQNIAPLMSVCRTGTIAFFAEQNDEVLVYDSSQQLIYRKSFEALEPDFIDLDFEGNQLLIGSQKNNHLSILNQQGEIIFERIFPFNLFKAVFSPVNPKLCYLTGSNQQSSYLYLLNTTSGVMDSVSTESYLDRNLALSSDGKRILLVGSNRIEVLDSLLTKRFSLRSEDATFSMARLSQNEHLLTVIDGQNAQIIDMRHLEEPLVSLTQVQDAVLSVEDNQLFTLTVLPNQIENESQYRFRIWPFGAKNVYERIEQMHIADLPENIKSLYGLK
ncbi:MAG: hypothetical protein DHS20C18_17240 [Saprospiraceae bacterium]|nr:MAG: hypothetical protein DHS20C18_17240 [Saprospiraceae bacterium]